MRKKRLINELPVASCNEGPSSGRTHKSFEFELITPMFGGDAESWKLDTKKPVRVQAIKGQFRFWWRTMQGETDYKTLLEQENKVWGGKISIGDKRRSIKSPVSISVSDFRIDPADVVEAEMRNNYAVRDDVIPGYVLFPITDQVKKAADFARPSGIFFIKKMSFTLKLAYDASLENDVMNTLKLWTLFGGVGARTRRGAGSIYCEELLGDFSSAQDIKDFLSGCAQGKKEPFEYPRLQGMLFYSHTADNSDTATVWHSLLEEYGNYRQSRVAQNSKHPGRSYWPEPDSIREITGVYSTHQPKHTEKGWFPRAAFGLPIQTEFAKDKGDPAGRINLQPGIRSGDRFPSPVILKVARLPNGQVLKCALVLNQKFPDKLVLKVKKKRLADISGDQLPFGPKSKMNMLEASGHPISDKSANIKSLNQIPTPENIYGHLATNLGLTKV